MLDFEKIEKEIQEEAEAEVKRVLKKSKEKKEVKFNVHKELKKGYHSQIIKAVIAGKDYEIAAHKMNDVEKGTFYIHQGTEPARKVSAEQIRKEFGKDIARHHKIPEDAVNYPDKLMKKLKTKENAKRLELVNDIYITKVGPEWEPTEPRKPYIEPELEPQQPASKPTARQSRSRATKNETPKDSVASRTRSASKKKTMPAIKGVSKAPEIKDKYQKAREEANANIDKIFDDLKEQIKERQQNIKFNSSKYQNLESDFEKLDDEFEAKKAELMKAIAHKKEHDDAYKAREAAEKAEMQASAQEISAKGKEKEKAKKALAAATKAHTAAQERFNEIDKNKIMSDDELGAFRDQVKEMKDEVYFMAVEMESIKKENDEHGRAIKAIQSEIENVENTRNEEIDKINEAERQELDEDAQISQPVNVESLGPEITEITETPVKRPLSPINSPEPDNKPPSPIVSPPPTPKLPPTKAPKIRKEMIESLKIKKPQHEAENFKWELRRAEKGDSEIEASKLSPAEYKKRFSELKKEKKALDKLNAKWMDAYNKAEEASKAGVDASEHSTAERQLGCEFVEARRELMLKQYDLGAPPAEIDENKLMDEDFLIELEAEKEAERFLRNSVSEVMGSIISEVEKNDKKDKVKKLRNEMTKSLKTEKADSFAKLKDSNKLKQAAKIELPPSDSDEEFKDVNEDLLIQLEAEKQAADTMAKAGAQN